MPNAIDSAMAIIRKAYGQGSIMYLSDRPSVVVPVIPTGCLSLDVSTGVGGFPCGRITEIYGEAGVGKSTLALHVVSQAQKLGKLAAYIDVEHALDMEYALTLGVDFEKFLISQPDDAESALEIAETLVRSGEVGIVIVDSVDALVPRAMIEGEMGDKHVAPLARLMSQAMRKLTAIIAKSKTCMIFINQIRHGIPVGGYGPTSFTSGGVALKFYSSMRIEIKRITALKDRDDRVVGNRTKTKIVKNKLSPPFKEAEFNLVFGKGIDAGVDLIDLAIKQNLISVSGTWYSYGDTRIGQGKEKAALWLTENEQSRDEIREAIVTASAK